MSYNVLCILTRGEFMQNDKRFLSGVKDGMPVCIGYLAVAFAFGISAVSQGLSAFQATLISMANVTSAGQLAAVPIIVSGGAYFELALSQLIINLRYALMSVSLSQRFDKSVTTLDRFILSFVNTDEIFAIGASKPGMLNRQYMYGLILSPYIGWSIGTVIGAAAGNILPAVLINALNLAIYGMFIAIVVPVAHSDKSVLACVAISVALSCAFKYIPFLKSVQSGFVIIICALISSCIMAALKPIEVQEETGGED